MEVQYDAVSMTNAGKPDIVVISGDFVCHSQVYLDDLTDVISKIDAPVFAALGNHDHWAGAEPVRKALRRGGAEVLDNAHTTITIGHQPLQVLGLDDAYTGHADHPAALKGLRRDLPVIGLSHIAEEADALWEEGVPLVFSVTPMPARSRSRAFTSCPSASSLAISTSTGSTVPVARRTRRAPFTSALG